MKLKDDTQVLQINDLRKDEKEVLALHRGGMRVTEIIKTLFKGKRTRQAVYDTLNRAKAKEFQLSAKERHAAAPERCPINELPWLPRLRNAFTKAGYHTVGDLAGLTFDDMTKIERVGVAGARIASELVTEWGVKHPGSFCPQCGKPQEASLKSGKSGSVKNVCDNCGFKTEIKVLRVPHGQSVGATA
jgi:predicted RNA-binding Zn-ribbon protein involved in translation (DUF1610 family)